MVGPAATAGSGVRSRETGSSERPSSPTGRPTESGSSNGNASRARARRRRRAARLFHFDRALGTRFVAGADEAGRGSLAGPLLAAAVPLDSATPSPPDR